jgi:hypothetical protein
LKSLTGTHALAYLAHYDRKKFCKIETWSLMKTPLTDPELVWTSKEDFEGAGRGIDSLVNKNHGWYFLYV